MSISSAYSSALSGLTAARRASGIVSENIANALTPGYARRSLELESAHNGAPGVRVTGVRRHADPVLSANRRGAEAEFGAARLLADFHSGVQGLVGAPDKPTSLGARLAGFETSLIEAASRPDSAQRLDAAVARADDLAKALVAASDGVRAMRTRANHDIGQQVDRLNRALSDVQKLNTRITSSASSGGNTSALLDQRGLLLDEINQIVPVKVVNRDHGQIALFTDGGAILLDGAPARLEFDPVTLALPHMTAGNGLLSGLKINGSDVNTAGQPGPISGGTLAAQFRIRDELSVAAQAELDTLARDLIERFDDPALDATLPAGAPGLFTDRGAAFDAATQTGLAGRLSLNAAVDPAQGGATWRLRAGLGATEPGPPGDARQIQSFGAALTAARAPLSAAVGTGALTAAGHVSGLQSWAGQRADTAELVLGFASASNAELVQIELSQGVDTDAELQNLMVIEQAYAANARMIQAVDEMMETLLRL